MRTRRELISNALQARLKDLTGKRIPQLIPARYDAMAGFVSEVQRQFLEASTRTVRLHTPDNWVSSAMDCLTSLQTLCLEGELEPGSAKHGPVDAAPSFVKVLDASRSDPELIFELLTARYACPTNFILPGEVAVREYVLTRLMVHSRARIEKQGDPGVTAGDLLNLNLVAVYAALTTDLRFLDALNYYYELLPSTWHPKSRHNWLFVSYLVLYARALAHLSEAFTECE